MLFCSTRDKAARVTASQAILNGLAPDGGLYLPCELPQFTEQQIDRMKKLDYRQTALTVLQAFLPDYSAEELEDAINKAYGSNFSSSQIAPLTSVKGNMWSLELYHGPTCAFKDFALQMLPHLMAGAMKKHADGKTVAILVATSGDTGKAALEGFANVPGTKICVFYPHGGTSEIQRLQMATQQGDNVNVLAVKGNFDDAQSGVKAIFTDAELAEKLAEHGVSLSSANSINWGRLAPQIAYYFWAYARLLRSGRICMGDEVNFCVPTGNFGNILAGYFAKKCGLPVGKLICASNQNNVLTQFFNTGVYDRNRPFHLTDSPSMDILISSNLERLLFLLTDGDDAQVREWMDSLKKDGKYDIGEAFLEKLRAEGFRGYCADDQRTAREIGDTLYQDSYLADPHTAVAINCAKQYASGTGDKTPTIVVSTASPFKFAPAMLPAIEVDMDANEFQMLEALELITGKKAPAQLMNLKKQQVRFDTVIEKEDMKQQVQDWLCR